MLDPPWENASAARGAKYASLPSRQLLRLPLPELLHPVPPLPLPRPHPCTLNWKDILWQRWYNPMLFISCLRTLCHAIAASLRRYQDSIPDHVGAGGGTGCHMDD